MLLIKIEFVTTDVELVRASDFMTQKEPRDQLLADCGFTLVEEFVVSCRAEFLMPSFPKVKNSLLYHVELKYS